MHQWLSIEEAMPTRQPATTDVVEYYTDPAVRARLREQCGERSGASATAAFIAGLCAPGAPPSWEHTVHQAPQQLDALCARGCDLARSLWDREHLLFFLELDYQNADAPAEPFVHPADVFLKLEPAYHAATRLFSDLSLNVRAMATGRGYHFLGQLPLDDPLVESLAAVLPDTPAWYAGVEGRRPEGVTAPLSERQARAAEGLGCLIEFAAHAILAGATASEIPVVFNGTAVGLTGAAGRECVSIDFSHVGDPLDIRHVRMAFSTYQWHRLRPDIFGESVASRTHPLTVLPRPRRSLMQLLLGGRELGTARRIARRTRMTLPDARFGVEQLLARYRASSLAAFHRVFYRDRAETGPLPDLNLAELPPCVGACLRQPNDLLLKPAHIQHLVRALLSRGWKAAGIARLVEAHYEADHEWGDRWTARMNRRSRADFDVRVFAGLIATGLDQLVDFNCVSAQEKGLCPGSGCPHDLRVDRDRLAAGRS
jgi:hypothetical protein